MSGKASFSSKLTKLVGSPLREIEEEFISVLEMQNEIMPDHELLTVFGDYDIYGMTIPTTIVGGDFYDFIDLEGDFCLEHKMGLVIADASGHGLSAAMLIRDFNTALYTAISLQCHYEQNTTSLLFETINRRMYRSSLENQFISAFYGELQLDGTLRYINAGHFAPLVFKEEGIVALEVGGVVLGALYDLQEPYAVGECHLEPGDRLLCYTDGIVETVNPQGEEYGLTRLKSLVRSSAAARSRDVFNAIIEDLESFEQNIGQSDDRTLIVLRRGSPA